VFDFNTEKEAKKKSEQYIGRAILDIKCPQIACMLKTLSATDGAIERCLDHRGLTSSVG
jgi:hypothetical protein